ncbi:MAG: SRPBCC family protein [Methylococcaceae bacterium]|nr:SRPBCC family protein [Methylococcaceae bacterium]
MPKCYQSIVIAAPIEKVWETVKNFHDFSWSAGVIDSCEAVGSIGGTEIGAKRILNGAFHETLLEYNEAEHRVRYSIDDGPSPVSAQEVKDYIGTLQLRPVTLSNATFVEWHSAWESRSEEAIDFCHQIYVALLRTLAQRLEQI